MTQRRELRLTLRASAGDVRQVEAAAGARLPNMLDGPDLHLMRRAASSACHLLLCMHVAGVDALGAIACNSVALS